MAIVDLLVHVDDTEACENRIVAAHKLAVRFDAHLAGLYAFRYFTYPVYTDVTIPSFIYAEEEARKKELAQQAQARFETLTNSWESKVSWHIQEGNIASTIINHSSNYDLVVVGQFNPDAEFDGSLGVAESVAIESGRPVLVIPYKEFDGNLGSRVVVAWNGRRESVRAVHDAMPLLEGADAVEIVSINQSKEIDIPCADIAQHLARHGVHVETENVRTDSRDIGEALLSVTESFGADMLVMGAYGHSRLRETILGGATRQILNKMSQPVLMSH